MNSADFRQKILNNISSDEEIEFSKDFLDLIDPYFGRINQGKIDDETEKIKKN